MRNVAHCIAGAVSAFVLGLPAAASAQEVIGKPEPWQMWYQPPSSTVMTQIQELNDFIHWIMLAVCILVLGLILYVARRFNAKRNPVPSKTAHNTLIEIIWTAVPILILVIISIPSFKLLYYMDRTQEADMTLKVIGHQWYWSYEYPDHGNFTFDSYMKFDEDLLPGEPRLLAVDNQIVLPVQTNVRILLTATDVIHAWAVPALGVKTDTVPGRLNETWVRIEQPGIYYGQCSELCGVNHAFMPIAIRAVPPEEFDAWVAEAQQTFAKVGGDAPSLAAEPAPEGGDDAGIRVAQSAAN